MHLTTKNILTFTHNPTKTVIKILLMACPRDQIKEILWKTRPFPFLPNKQNLVEWPEFSSEKIPQNRRNSARDH